MKLTACTACEGTLHMMKSANLSSWHRIPVIVSLLFFVICSSVRADTVPLQMNFQAHLKDSEGFLRSGLFDITMNLYADEFGGTSLWTEAHNAVPVSGGLFRLTLGATNPLNPMLFDGFPRWLGITISGDSGEMVPRISVLSVAHAIHSYDAVHATRSQIADSAYNAQLLDSHPVGYFTNSDNFSGTNWQLLTGGGIVDSLHHHSSANSLTVGDSFSLKLFAMHFQDGPSFAGSVHLVPFSFGRDTRSVAGRKFYFHVDGLAFTSAPSGPIGGGGTIITNVYPIYTDFNFVTMPSEFESFQDVPATGGLVFKVREFNEDYSKIWVTWQPPGSRITFRMWVYEVDEL